MSTVVVESTVSFHVNKVKNNTNQCADNFCYTMSHGINTRIELNYFPFLQLGLGRTPSLTRNSNSSETNFFNYLNSQVFDNHCAQKYILTIHAAFLKIKAWFCYGKSRGS